MKKLIIGIVLVTVLLTGCMKMNLSMEIKDDKSMEFKMLYAVKKEILEQYAEEESLIDEETLENMKKAGFMLEDYDNGDMKGYVLTQKIPNIDTISTASDIIFDLNKMLEGMDNNLYMFKVERGNNKNTYYAKFKIDFSKSILENENITDNNQDSEDSLENNNIIGGSIDDEQLQNMLASGVDLSFSIILPNSVLNSNASTIEDNGRRLNWNLLYNKENNIEFSFELGNNDNTNVINKDDSKDVSHNEIVLDDYIVYTGLGVIGLLLIIIIILGIRISKLKKQNKYNENY